MNGDRLFHRRRVVSPPQMQVSASMGLRKLLSPTPCLLRKLLGEAVGKTINVDDSVNAFEILKGRSVVVKLTSLDVLKSIYSILKEMRLGEGVVRC